MTEARRPRRVGGLLLREVAEILQKNVKDPRVGLVTVTGAEMSPDLLVARVYYTILDQGADRGEVERGLKSASPFIRRGLARRLRLKAVPEIHFVHDESVDRGFRLLEILEEVRHDPEEPHR
jgi:ribosome-binding factor A